MSGREIKRTMITYKTNEFLDRFRPLEDNSTTSYVFVFLIAIDIVVLLFVWGAPALLLYQRGRGYKGSHRVGYNCSSSWTLSLFFPN
jgi:hypothetical protein